MLGGLFASGFPNVEVVTPPPNPIAVVLAVDVGKANVEAIGAAVVAVDVVAPNENPVEAGVVAVDMTVADLAAKSDALMLVLAVVFGTLNAIFEVTTGAELLLTGNEKVLLVVDDGAVIDADAAGALLPKPKDGALIVLELKLKFGVEVGRFASTGLATSALDNVLDTLLSVEIDDGRLNVTCLFDGDLFVSTSVFKIGTIVVVIGEVLTVVVDVRELREV